MATSSKDDKKGVQSDAELAAGMVLAPIYTQKGGIEKMLKVVTSANDPADALAHALFALFSQARNALLQNGIKVDNKAWLAKGGAVDIVIKDVLGIIASTVGKQLSSSAFARDTKNDLVKIMKSEMDTAKAPPPDHAPGMGGAPMPMQGGPGGAPQGPPPGPPQGGPPQGGLLSG